MPNEESPVDSMEFECEEDQPQIHDQKNGDTAIPMATPSPEVVAEELKNLGNAEYAKKDYSKAIEYYTQAIDTFQVASYFGNRAAAYVMLTQFSKALEDARKSTQLDPTFTKGYLREAKCQLALGEVAAAVHLYEKVLEKEPGNATALAEHKQAKYVQGLLLKSDLSYQKDDFRTVIYNMDRCIEICPHCSKFKILKAECLTLLKRYDEAQNLASDVLRVDGLCADAIYVRGLCLYYTDVYDKAFQHFQQVLRIAPDHGKARDAYRKAKSLKTKKDEGNAAYSKGKYAEAEALYKEALTVDPLNVASNSKLNYNLATVYIQMKKYDEAINHCTSAIQLDKAYTKAYIKRAHCYTELEKFEEAVKEYETILKFDKSREIKTAYERAKMRLKKSKRKDYYKILSVSKTATDDEIKKAYRKHALLHHPDRHSSATEEVKKAEEKKFKEVGEAYSVLSDPKKRPLYDSGHDLEEIQNGGAGGFDGNIDPNIIFQSFFGGGQKGGFHSGGFHQGGFSSGGFPGFSFSFGGM